MTCDFERIGEALVCRRCKRSIVTDCEPEKCHAVCEAGDCRWLGKAPLRLVGCESCGGNVQIKVFACAVHGETTVGKQLEGLACCATCDDYQPREKSCSTH